jgi:type IV secretory pathway TrbD component
MMAEATDALLLGTARNAVVISNLYCVTAGAVARSWWPIAGMLLGDIYMVWLYERALARGQSTGSDSWGPLQAAPQAFAQAV